MSDPFHEPVRVTCHCGAVELRVTLSDGLATARRCDCSFCRRRGTPAVSVPLEGLTVLRGADKLTLYTWGTGTAKHYFCSVCGIYTITAGARPQMSTASTWAPLRGSIRPIMNRLAGTTASITPRTSDRPDPV